MSKTDPYYEAIESYLSGSMAEEGRIEFEKNLETDPILSKKWQAYQLADQLVFENRLLNIKETAKSVHIQSTKRGQMDKYGLLGAVLLVGAGALWYSVSLKEEPHAPSSVQVAPPSEALSRKEENKLPESEKQSKAEQNYSSTPAIKQEEVPPATRGVVDKKEEVAIAREVKAAQGKQEPEKEAVPTLAKKDESVAPCAGIHLSAEHHTTAACEGKSNGAIHLSSFKGGKAPYSYTVHAPKGIEATAQTLEAGLYKLSIKDANGCETEIGPVEVKSQKCKTNYHFNPFAGETWQIPVHHLQGTFTVLDKAGNVYFSMSIAAGTEALWDGQSSAGELKTGLFLFQIQYSDGSLEQGTISIVR